MQTDEWKILFGNLYHMVLKRLGIGAADLHLPHVVNIKPPDNSAGDLMLQEGASWVLNRHFVTGKRHRPSTVIDVQLAQLCAFQVSCHINS